MIATKSLIRSSTIENQLVLVGDDVRSMDPLWVLMREETMACDARGCRLMVKAISASYDRFSNGACVPVQELGSKTLG